MTDNKLLVYGHIKIQIGYEDTRLSISHLPKGKESKI